MKNLTKNFWVLAVLVLIAGASVRPAFADPQCPNGRIADTLETEDAEGAPAAPPPPPPGNPSTAAPAR